MPQIAESVLTWSVHPKVAIAERDSSLGFAARIAERVRAEIEQERFVIGETGAAIGITVSIGLAERGGHV